VSRKDAIENWFSIVSPTGKRLAILKEELHLLTKKNWQEIHR